MKILGIGVDIENIERFQKLTIKNDSRFLNKIYTENELQYCFSKKNPAPHLAARFAGKEAVIKAMSGISNKKFSVKDVAIINLAKGSPVVKMSNILDDDACVYLSLSHCQDKAVAFAVITEMGST